MLALDYVGLGTLITAVGATVVSIIVAIRQTGTHSQIADVQRSVKMSNGDTLAQGVEKISANNP